MLLPVDAEAIEKSMLRAGKQSALTAWEAYERRADGPWREYPAGIDAQILLDDIRES